MKCRMFLKSLTVGLFIIVGTTGAFNYPLSKLGNLAGSPLLVDCALAQAPSPGSNQLNANPPNSAQTNATQTNATQSNATQPNATQPKSPKPNPTQTNATSSLEDYTEKLKPTPGLTMVFPIHAGCDRNGQSVRDYSMAVEIEPPSKDCSLSFKWAMSELGASGVRAIDNQALKTSRKVSLFYKPGEAYAMIGFTNAIRISDAMYHDLKNGVSSPIQLDGPFSQHTRHVPAIPLPQNITKVEEELVPIQVDEKTVSVRTLKATGDNPAGAPGSNQPGGWTYWILDNPNFPMMVKGIGPFVWDAPIINSGDFGTKEGKRIVRDLNKNGIATTNAILFDFDSDRLKPSAKPILDVIVTYLKDNPAVKLKVQGHCDIVGGFEYNMDLSRRRAKSVKRYLIDHGIAAERLQSEGYGYTKPVATNRTAVGRSKNRRVVFEVIAK